MRRSLLPMIWLTCMAVMAGPDAALAQEYEIRLHRPETVGSKFRFSGEGAMMRKTSITIAGQPKEQPEEGVGIRLEGVIEVLAVTPKGKVSKLSCTVEKCVSEGDAPQELVPAGKVIIAEATDSRTQFSLNEGELSPEASQSLELLFSLAADDERATDDEIFGTTAKQSVGGTWPLNAERAAKDFATEKVTVSPENISGTLQLVGVEQVEGVECLNLTGRVSAKDLKPPEDAAQGLPEGVKAQAGSLDYRFGIKLPVDPALHAVEETMSARHKVVFAGEAPPIKLETTIVRAATVKRTPVK